MQTEAWKTQDFYHDNFKYLAFTEQLFLTVSRTTTKESVNQENGGDFYL